MLNIRKSTERGAANHGWLDSKHTFSFASYFDPQHMGFRSLRVINEDVIAGGTGFNTHPHRDMEIITYVVAGSLEHKDSMGNQTIILPGEVQRMSAGTGIMHSEFNHEKKAPTHLFQIWIMPDVNGGNPSYGQKSFEAELNSQKLVLVVSKDERQGSIGIKQDADMYISRLKSGEEISFNVRPGRGVWIQLLKGQITINENIISTGDAVYSEDENLLQISSQENSEFILFDLI
jgi:redox-sensitive bicupin YhaK (pirin superfamily)